MDNLAFLAVLKTSFIKYLETGSRSNEKLKILHGAVANDIFARIKSYGGYNFSIKSLGVDEGKEVDIEGRYINKKVDIVIQRDNRPIAGIGLKFVMSNYKQNSNNYFENMLGETANIRCNNKHYFQIFIIPDKIPYYDNNKNIKNWENINEHNLKKYITLSFDDTTRYMHTPDKTLLYIIRIVDESSCLLSVCEDAYSKYYNRSPFIFIAASDDYNFGDAVIYNDYEKFADKITHSILSI